MNAPGTAPHTRLIDRFSREVNYVRLSVTDRCDFRCVYCMAEDMTFLPRSEVLSLEELFTIGEAFTQLGVTKIRVTGGEPLVRRNIMSLFNRLGTLPGLEELVLTTNGSQLHKTAAELRDAGVKRINISIDSLRPDRFREITRTGDLAQVLAGIETAKKVGFEKLKLNAVILKGRNHDEIIDLVNYAAERELDISFIEEMPLGLVEHNRELNFCSSQEIFDVIATRYALRESPDSTGGPSRYHQLADSNTRIGFISPHSHNFCHLCNRVRVTAEGRLLLCLGNEHSVDLKEVLRAPDFTSEHLQNVIINAMEIKPERHNFDLSGEPEIVRFMSMTGG
jgi:cyclic pyranopterin phosphate synthase